MRIAVLAACAAVLAAPARAAGFPEAPVVPAGSQAARVEAGRWNGYTRRGLAPDTRETASEVLLVAGATLAF